MTTREQKEKILEDLEWNATDISDAREALKEAQRDLITAKRARIELKAKLAEMKTQTTN
jgi:hypothetical protein